MRYEDPIVTENVNVSKEPPIKTLFKLLVALTVLCVIGYLLITIFVYQIIRFVPFSYEQKMFNSMVQSTLTQFVSDAEYPDKVAALQAIADKLTTAAIAADEESPLQDMQITMHYSSSTEVNAFATLGGHVVVNEGLIQLADSENMLAMVIAHEISHVMHRDAFQGLGRGIATSIVFAALFDASATNIPGTGLQLMQLNYSRDTETKADTSGLVLLNNAYNNAYGAENLFNVFAEVLPQNSKWVEVSLTHPLPTRRRDRVRELISDNGMRVDADSAMVLTEALLISPSLEDELNNEESQSSQ